MVEVKDKVLFVVQGEIIISPVQEEHGSSLYPCISTTVQ